MFSTTQFTLENGIYVRSWTPENPRMTAVAVHGMGTHSGRFDKIATWLARQGVQSFCYDHPGHGLSTGKRGHINSLNDLLNPLNMVLNLAREKSENDNIFLFGHSMGGNVALNFLLRHKPEVKAAVVSSPWLKLAFDPPFFKMILAKAVVNIWPGLKQDSKLKVNYISHDPEVLKHYDDDPLIHSTITPRFFLELSKAGSYALENAHQLDVPTFLFHGTDDHITSYPASKEFASKSKKVYFKAWEGCYHEVHNEWVFEDLMQETLQFLLKHANLPDTAQNK